MHHHTPVLRRLACNLRHLSPSRTQPQPSRHHTAAAAGTKEDEDAVRRICQDYLDATYEGDQTKLAACFHESAVMNGFVGAGLFEGTPAGFIAGISKGPSFSEKGLDYRCHIAFVHVSGSAASAAVTETGYDAGAKGTISFTDYFHRPGHPGAFKRP